VNVTLNGSELELRDGATVVDAVVAAAGDPERRGIAVALAGAVVPRSRWGQTLLRNGDRVEVLEARQGG
jgi:sulfur carrier protein